MLKKVLLAVAAALVVLAVVIATRPSDYRIQRTTRIAASPEVVYGQVASLRRWEAWSPWAKLDPGMKAEYGGPEAGPGATYHWSGNKAVGEGRMTVLDVRPAAQVRIHLEFLAPMKDEAITTFGFAPAGDGTEVTWDMAGKMGFVGKAMCLVTSMDQVIGPDFEKGLAALKGVAEAQARSATAEAQ